MVYQALIIENDGMWTVSFPDKRNIFTEGRCLEDALKHAEEALNLVLEVEIKLGSDIELPRHHIGDCLYDIPVHPIFVEKLSPCQKFN